MSKCIFILGMHRSGTSALAGSLQEAGLYLGKVLSNSLKGRNEKGLQEPAALVHMHENLLQANGGSWDAPPEKVVWQPLHRAVRDLFIESRSQVPLWGFKEPRTLLTFNGWAHALEDWSAVGIFRAPQEVALSLQSRNQMPLEQGLQLWLQYNRRLLDLQAQHGFPVIEFSKDSGATSAGIRRAAAWLGLAPPEEAGFYEPALRNFEAAEQTLPPEVQAAYAELQSRCG